MVQIITNDNIKDAVNLWCDNKDEAIEIYGHIISWDVSNVTDMSNLFKDKSEFNDDISKWLAVSNVTNMEKMFYNGCSFNQDINTKEITKENGDVYIAWNVSNVTNMKHMFFRVTTSSIKT